MDIFRYPEPVNGNIDLSEGILVEGWESVSWVERYRDPCDFIIEGYAENDLQTKLPIGSLISKINSAEIMVVENHQIKQTRNEKSTVTITGRSFETFLEQRVINANQNFKTRPNSYKPAASIFTGTPAGLAQSYILGHITGLTPSNNSFNYLKDVETLVNVIENNGSVEYTERLTTLYDTVIELLNIDNLGIRTVRPNFDSTNPTDDKLYLIIHDGVNRTSQVGFSYDFGDIESADYLWSDKSVKNCAYVFGRVLDTFVDLSSKNGLNRRTMIVDASDVDENLPETPTSAEINTAINLMKARGRAALYSKIKVEITNVKISNLSNAYKYRVDYNLGDLVSVKGDYNTSNVMRVIEYVEISDRNGTSGYPTLGQR